MYGEQWYFTYTAEAFESQLVLQKAGEVEEQARLEAEAEVKRPPRDIKLRRLRFNLICHLIVSMLIITCSNHTFHILQII